MGEIDRPVERTRKLRAQLIGVDYVTRAGKPAIRLLLKRKRFFRLYDPDFAPYFYVLPAGPLPQAIPALQAVRARGNRGESLALVQVRPVTKEFFGKQTELLLVVCGHPSHVPILREAVRKAGIGRTFEDNILFGRRYMIDRGLAPFDMLEIERVGKHVKSVTSLGPAPAAFRTLAFDIETYNPHGAPREELDPVVMISYGDKEPKILTWKPVDGRPWAHVLPDEKSTIQAFLRVVREADAELLVGFNSSQFDLPYLRARAKANGIPLALGRDGKSEFRLKSRGFFTSATIAGRIHFDLYPVARFLEIIGQLKTYNLTLADVYSELVGTKHVKEAKLAVNKLDIHKLWDDAAAGRLQLADYARNDALATRELLDVVLPMQVELARVARVQLQDAIGSTTGTLVEALLVNNAHHKGIVSPNKPGGPEAAERAAVPIKGAFVKTPPAGVYSNLAVFDFRGLYPSIIVSHNIDPHRINCGDCTHEESYIAPTGDRFCGKRRGLVPEMVASLLKTRAVVKDELKRTPRESPEYKILDARQTALKVLANSVYGMLTYARARWYSREAGEAVTAWGRKYIQDAISAAESAGFTVLYGDTDSLFLQLGNATKEAVLDFVKKLNAGLPAPMELELEGFYPRGLFVTKKIAGGGERGAKKKYAMLGEDGRIKIKGFELVRRDWSKIAKNTQQAVLEAILKEGSKERAVEIVRNTITRLREGGVPLSELAIYTQLRKGVGKYEVISPELAAVQKALARGGAAQPGAIVSYVITRTGRSISEKAQLVDFAKDYDPGYYIDHQVLPAVLKIMKELGYSEDDLKLGGRQATLGDGWE